MAGKLVLVVGRRPQFLIMWILIGLLECPYDMVLASPEQVTEESKEEVEILFITSFRSAYNIYT